MANNRQSLLVPWNPEAAPRDRRFQQLVAGLLNSLIRSGQLSQAGEDWDIQFPAAAVGGGGGFGANLRGADGNRWATGAGPPQLRQGRADDFYFDQVYGDVWHKQQPSPFDPPAWVRVANLRGGQPGRDGQDGQNGAPGLPGPLGATGPQGAAGTPGSAAAVTLIGTQTLGLAAASVTFSSIPASYTHLELMLVAAGDASAQQVESQLTFNSDTGTNYDQELIIEHGSTIAGAEALAASSIDVGAIAAATSPAGASGAYRATIFGYLTAFHKAVESNGYFRKTTGAGNSFNLRYSGIWKSTSAITRIDLAPSSGNWAAGSVFSLYGIS